jgi:Glu-tRNA(Gln) amidotransferase subunit E-like FAD-binding protein
MDKELMSKLGGNLTEALASYRSIQKFKDVMNESGCKSEDMFNGVQEFILDVMLRSHAEMTHISDEDSDELFELFADPEIDEETILARLRGLKEQYKEVQ